MAAAIEAPDILVGHVRHHLLERRILAEEVLARIGTALGLEILVLPIDAVLHHALQDAARIARQQRIPA